MSLLSRLLPRRRFDFHGGIHPPERKALSNGTPIRPGPMPAQLILPLTMHIGAPARPLVQVGDRVLKGEKIAEASGPVSVPVHAPSSGVISAIEPRPIQHPSGLDAPCIVLDTDGEDRWTALHPHPDFRAIPRPELLALIREAGIAGLGGAGFPTAIKLNLRDNQRIEQLILNAVECEPYITADDRLMRERAPALIRGIEILRYLVQPAETIVAIEDNKPEAIAAMRAAAEGTGIRIMTVPTKYPSGGEKQLIRLVTGKEVRSGGIPAEIGVVCQNIGTAYAVERAVVHGEPLIRRITTLTGEAFTQPGNVETLIGTPVQALLEAGGVTQPHRGRLIMGGPMMGFSIDHPMSPVVKTSNCIIAAPLTELPEPAPEQSCIRCGACADVCPAELLPQQLYWYSKAGEFDRARHYNLLDCIECGACSYVCPSNIPLVQYYRYAKAELRKQAAEHQKADRARERFEARTARIEKEKAEKEARRQARLAANRVKQAPDAAAPPAQADLKKAVNDASAAYKTAVKAAKEAEASGADNAVALRAEAERLKAHADALKANLRDAKAAGPAAPAHDDGLPALKKAVADASAAYKAAVKAMKDVEAGGDGDIDALRADTERLKAEADRLKAALRDAKAAAPAVVAAPVQEDPVAALKKAVADASSAYKAAVKAAKEAEASGDGDLDALRAEAERLKPTGSKPNCVTPRRRPRPHHHQPHRQPPRLRPPAMTRSKNATSA
ncbi:electron transport complex protein RnfC [Alcanivorax sp. S71-1-4]|uniref:electron transport complex subunit RsxC n=1 Tax=Alcanivorax sp. S71-1-4 TaxID=1177159 RepID=UPI001699174E|nr:electron transport complex subunit RsxC [Alcanivorax sp. S71-1-4]KAF0806436.1 electron transport complex protein RnfC [Alcanivorax sp. S71-1-4]